MFRPGTQRLLARSPAAHRVDESQPVIASRVDLHRCLRPVFAPQIVAGAGFEPATFGVRVAWNSFIMQTLQHLWRPGSTEKYPLDTPLGVYRESVWEFEPNAGRFCLHRNFGLPRWKSAPCGMNPRRQLVQIGEARISIAFLAVK